MQKKKYQLGELHDSGPFSWYEKDSYCEDFNAVMREVHIRNVLDELYHKTDVKQIEWLVLEASEAFQNYEVDEIENFTYKDLIFQVDNNSPIDICKAEYNPRTLQTTIYIGKSCVEKIKNKKDLESIIRDIKGLITHEDTHKQQNQADKRSIKPKNIQPNDFEKYINQKTEVDAYARQFGAELRDLYPEETTDEIFKRIQNGKISDKNLLVNIDSLLQPNNVFTEKSKQLFLRNLYDYVEGNES